MICGISYFRSVLPDKRNVFSGPRRGRSIITLDTWAIIPIDSAGDNGLDRQISDRKAGKVNDKGTVISGRKPRLRAVLGILGGIVGIFIGLTILSFTGEIEGLGGGEKALRIIFGIAWFSVCFFVIVLNSLRFSGRAR